MDMTLDDRIAASRRGNRSRSGTRGAIRKSTGGRTKGSTSGAGSGFNDGQYWDHDKFADDDDEAMLDDRSNSRNGNWRGGSRRGGRTTGGRADGTSGDKGYRVVISNLHEDIIQEDLEKVFKKVRGLREAKIFWQRDRSTGRAQAIYDTYEQAQQAVRDFDGQLAYSQEFHVKYDDEYNRPKRSLEERISFPNRSPERSPRRSDLATRAPPHIDRYVPGQRDRTPNRDRRPRDQGRDRRPRGGRGGGRSSRPAKKTAEELDQEMADYFGETPAEGAESKPAPAQDADMEVDEML